MSANANGKQSKRETLRGEGTLNPAPHKVRDPKFLENTFFDPSDEVQVKYEMLRRVLVEGVSVIEAVREYGVSRPTFYQAKANFDAAGIAGLVRARPGPRHPHKIDEEILAFLRSRMEPGKPVRARELAIQIRRELDIELHPRTIERALKKSLR